MIINHRTYTVTPRRMGPYLKLVEELALPVMLRHGFELAGYYVTMHGPLNQVVHLWKYDSLADLERKRAARDADPAWADYLSRTEGMVQSQEDRILAPTAFSPDFVGR
jgi:hypothetical protein